MLTWLQDATSPASAKNLVSKVWGKSWSQDAWPGLKNGNSFRWKNLEKGGGHIWSLGSALVLEGLTHQVGISQPKPWSSGFQVYRLRLAMLPKLPKVYKAAALVDHNVGPCPVAFIRMEKHHMTHT